jgi:hypothetical protein
MHSRLGLITIRGHESFTSPARVTGSRSILATNVVYWPDPATTTIDSFQAGKRHRG